MPIRSIRRALILVLISTLATSCGNGGSTGAGSDPTIEPSAGPPASEGTGTESPARRRDEPAVEIAGGPAGDGGKSENDDGSWCLDVRWLGGQDDANLGGGVAFKVTRVHLRGAKRADFSCRDESCEGFTFDSNSDNCSVAVRPGNDEGRLSLYGRILCSAELQECREFRSKLKLRTISIPASDTTVEEPPPSSPNEQPSPAG